MKSTTALEVNVGMKFCKDCEYNLRCLECAYKGKYEALAEKHDFLLDEADKLHTLAEKKQQQIDCLKKALDEENKKLISQSKQFYKDGIKDFAHNLCVDKLSNDPVVIAVKTELKLAGIE